MNSSEIENKIKALEKAIESPATPQALLPKMKEQLEALRSQLQTVLEQERQEEAKKESKSQQRERVEKYLKERQERNKPTPKPKKKMEEPVKTEGSSKLEECKDILKAWRSSKAKEAKARQKSEKKPVSAKVVDGLIRTVSGAISRELTQEKVVKIKTDKLRDSKDQFEKALASLRSALGGISDENDKIIKDFRVQFEELIDKVEELQQEIQKKAA